MTAPEQPGWRRAEIVRAAAYLVVYVALAWVCLETALEQANTAAVWMPSGFAVGLVIAEGRKFWLVALVGSAIVNLATNLAVYDNAPLFTCVAVSSVIAFGNGLESLVGHWLAERFASGRRFLDHSRSFAMFCLLAPIPAAISAAFGSSAVYVGNLGPDEGDILEIALTWVTANAVGIIVFASLTCALLTRPWRLPKAREWIEIGLLVLGIMFFGHALNGTLGHNTLMDFPRAYMCIPLLLWAAVRFGAHGALLSILLITLIAVSGTMAGFVAFPAPTPTRSLIYLQIFIGLVAVMTIALSSALHEVRMLQLGLERKVRERTAQVEQLLRDREALTTLVAHDLRSPLYGVRNASRAAGQALALGTIGSHDLVETLKVIDDTCEALATRINGLLAPAAGHERPPSASEPERLDSLVRRILRVHQIQIEAKRLGTRVACAANPALSAGHDIEHILDVLIDNAVKHAPAGGEISVLAEDTRSGVTISIEDNGPGVAPEKVHALFNSSRGGSKLDAPAGLGLGHAKYGIEKLGGALWYQGSAGRRGATFVVRLPVEKSSAQ